MDISKINNNDHLLLLGIPKINNNDHPLLIEEYKQAWEHYRHLENLRAKHVNWSVTFFLSALAFNGLMFRLEGKLGYDVYFIIYFANVLMLVFLSYITDVTQGASTFHRFHRWLFTFNPYRG